MMELADVTDSKSTASSTVISGKLPTVRAFLKSKYPFLFSNPSKYPSDFRVLFSGLEYAGVSELADERDSKSCV